MTIKKRFCWNINRWNWKWKSESSVRASDDYNLNGVWHERNGFWNAANGNSSSRKAFVCSLCLIIWKSFEWSHNVCMWFGCRYFHFFYISSFMHSRCLLQLYVICYMFLCLGISLHRNRWINSPKAFQVVKEFLNV